ncbi:Coatomer beta subunit [Giardia duodenalis]|uniref:Coatomer beta subunit n=1 Tax=Giardia intestinalis TaxID=5741 RepID=V6TPA8_GIAIN|nr:Coatomer beta subunit [Giardia intestinalis]
MPVVVTEASEDPADPGTLCRLANRRLCDAQDSIIIAVSCRYLLTGSDAYAKMWLYAKEGTSGLLLLGIAEDYKAIEKNTALRNGDLWFLHHREASFGPLE